MQGIGVKTGVEDLKKTEKKNLLVKIIILMGFVGLKINYITTQANLPQPVACQRYFLYSDGHEPYCVFKDSIYCNTHNN